MFRGSVRAVNAALAAVRYVPGVNWHGAAKVWLHVADFGFTGIGGPLADDASLEVAVMPVNDAPRVLWRGVEVQSAAAAGSRSVGGRGSSSSSSSGSGAGKTLDITLLCIDENPGAVQSGHYVWPAATALARHLVNAWTSNEHSDEARQANDILSSRAGIPKAIVELGAGCGLAGLTALHLGCSTVVFTDHDAGTLDLIRDNIELQDLDSANIKNVFACPLAWGEEFRSSWPSQVTAHLTDEAGGGFDLLLASDVIYDSGVVEPLLWTVRHLLAPNGKAMLCGSFRLEDGTDDQVDSICKSMGMVCVTLYDNLGDGGCRLQEITLL